MTHIYSYAHLQGDEHPATQLLTDTAVLCFEDTQHAKLFVPADESGARYLDELAVLAGSLAAAIRAIPGDR